MKKFLPAFIAVLGWLALVPSAHAAISLVQATTTGGTFPGSPFTIRTATAPSNNDVLILTIDARYGGATGTITSVSTPNVTWHLATSTQVNSSLVFDLETWYGLVSGTAGNTTTITQSNISEWAGNISEWSGVNTITPLDGVGVVATGTGKNPVTGSLTTNSSTDLLYGAFSDESSGSNGQTVPSGYTDLGFQSTADVGSLDAMYKIATSTGTYSTNWGTLTFSSNVWQTIYLAFQPAPMGIAARSSCRNTNPTGLTYSCTSTSTFKSGDLIIAVPTWRDAAANSEASDTAGQSFTICGTNATELAHAFDAGRGAFAQAWYVTAPSTGTCTATTTLSSQANVANLYFDWELYDIYGANNSSPVDASSTGTGAQQNPTTGALTLTGTDLVFGDLGTADNGAATYTPQSGFNLDDSFGTTEAAFESAVTSTSPITPSFTGNSTLFIAMISFAIKPSAGGGGGGTASPPGPHVIVASSTKIRGHVIIH